MPDFEHGVWVFSNIDRDFVCSNEGLLGLASYQRVEAADAAVLRISAPDAPTWLHPIVGEVNKFFNPCDSSARLAAFMGSVDIRANDAPTRGGALMRSATVLAVWSTTVTGWTTSSAGPPGSCSRLT
jgi:hypothetical protein